MKKLVPTKARIGKYVQISGEFDDTEKAKFVSKNKGRDFLVIHIDNFSANLKGVPFRVRHDNIYRVAEVKEGDVDSKESKFIFVNPTRSVTLRVDRTMFDAISKNSGKLEIDEHYINDHVLKYIVYTCTDFIKGENGIENGDFDTDTIEVAKFLDSVVKEAKYYDEVIIERI